MSNIKVDFSSAGVPTSEILKYSEKVIKIHEELYSKKDNGKEFLGWLDLPVNYDKEEFERIKKAADKIKKDSEILVVIGIGGSYLGARAVIESLTHTFYNLQKRETPTILYAGNNMSPRYILDIIDLIGNKDFSINVISKSGTTTEPAIAFRIFREILENKYGIEEAKKRIYVTTDKEKGALKTLSNEEDYETFVIPDNVGGRYSVLTAVGLLPIAVAGIDIDKLMEFCQTPRTSREILEFLGKSYHSYNLKKFIQPLVESFILIPTSEKNNDSNKKFVARTK